MCVIRPPTIEAKTAAIAEIHTFISLLPYLYV